MEDRHLPEATSTLVVDVRGAEIVDEEEAPETSDIYLPKHTEFISHIALDIGGSLAKVVYFTRASTQQAQHLSKRSPSTPRTLALDDSHQPGTHTPRSANTQPNGILTPKAVRDTFVGPLSRSASFSGCELESQRATVVSALYQKLAPSARRRASSSVIPGGRLNFTKFETEMIEKECIPFIAQLISTSAEVNGVPLEHMRKAVKIMATGGGAHMYYDVLTEQLGCEVSREEEMDCLITGLNFLTEIPFEVFWFSDDRVVDETSHQQQDDLTLPRPSPNPPQYSLEFDQQPTPQFPCLLVNIGSGVSMIKIDSQGQFERISGTSLGGGTLWGLLSLLTSACSFDEMLNLSLRGDNAQVDMLVGDIYGQDYGKIGLKSSTIASSFGKVFRKGRQQQGMFKEEDISKSLLYAISNNIGQIAFLNAEKYELDRIYFGGCFIRGHAATVSTLSYAIRFWSKGSKRAFFLRHEGYLGAVGAWVKHVSGEEER